MWNVQSLRGSSSRNVYQQVVWQGSDSCTVLPWLSHWFTMVCQQLQIIVCVDGAAGINFEHTGVNGHTILRYMVSMKPFSMHADKVIRFAANVFTGSLMFLECSINPSASASTLFHILPSHMQTCTSHPRLVQEDKATSLSSPASLLPQTDTIQAMLNSFGCLYLRSVSESGLQRWG